MILDCQYCPGKNASDTLSCHIYEELREWFVGMVMTIELKPEQEQVIGEAIRAGLIETADDVVDVGVEAIRHRLEERRSTTVTLSGDEWMRKFRAWAHSHPTDTPLLSDEAMSREFIYGERGL